MISESPSAAFVAYTDPYISGLTGTLGVRIMLGEATIVARSAADVVESPAGSGIYFAPLTAPADEGRYLVVFDDGTNFASEDLLVGSGVTSGPTIGVAAPGIPSGPTISLLIGDSYMAADGRRIVLSESFGAWPDLTGADVMLSIGNDDRGIVRTFDGVVLADLGETQQIGFELTSEQSSELLAGRGHYIARGVKDGLDLTLARGHVHVYSRP